MFLRSEWLVCIGCVYYNAIVCSRPSLPGPKRGESENKLAKLRSGTSLVQPKRNLQPPKLCSLQCDHAPCRGGSRASSARH